MYTISTICFSKWLNICYFMKNCYKIAKYLVKMYNYYIANSATNYCIYNVSDFKFKTVYFENN